MQTIQTVPSGSKLFMVGDALYRFCQYNDLSGKLTIGMPVFKDCSDASQFNTINTTTAMATSTAFASAGKVVLSTTSVSASATLCMGVFQGAVTTSSFVNPAIPNTGDIIIVLINGPGVVQAQCATSSGIPVTVGGTLVSSSTVANAVQNNGTVVNGTFIGMACAGTTALTYGNTIIARPASGTTVALVNAQVQIQ